MGVNRAGHSVPFFSPSLFFSIYCVRADCALLYVRCPFSLVIGASLRCVALSCVARCNCNCDCDVYSNCTARLDTRLISDEEVLRPPGPSIS